MTQHSKSKTFAWLELVRFPNLFTVPGDPIAGYFLAATLNQSVDIQRVIMPAFISLLLYMAGLISNDYFDLEKNRKQRPDRPLPSGRVNPSVAIIIASCLVVAALMISLLSGSLSFLVTVALTVAILVYNAGSKQIPIVGSINMGLCRGLSFLLGASVAYQPGDGFLLIVLTAVCFTLYIAGITSIASREEAQVYIGNKRWLPAVAVISLFVLFALFMIKELNIQVMLSIVIAIIALSQTLSCALSLVHSPQPSMVSLVVGKLICNVLFLQVFILLLCQSPAWIFGLPLIIFRPICSILARKFYSS